MPKDSFWGVFWLGRCELRLIFVKKGKHILRHHNKDFIGRESINKTNGFVEFQKKRGESI